MYKKMILLSLLSMVTLFADVYEVSNVGEFRRALRNAATDGSHATIVLDQGVYSTAVDSQGRFYYGSTENYNLTIKAKDDLTASDVVLDGNDTTGVLNILFPNTNNIIAIENITLQNSALVNGGAIFTSGSLILDKVKIRKCIGTYGGAIYLDKNEERSVLIKDSNISQNGATGGGSVIYARSYGHYSDINFTNVIFDSNYRSSLMHFEGWSGEEPVNMVNCKFINNSTSGNDPLLDLKGSGVR